MGYALAHGNCIGCGRLFSFNPMREKNGLPRIVPAPDAYDAVDEGELT